MRMVTSGEYAARWLPSHFVTPVLGRVDCLTLRSEGGAPTACAYRTSDWHEVIIYAPWVGGPRGTRVTLYGMTDEECLREAENLVVDNGWPAPWLRSSLGAARS